MGIIAGGSGLICIRVPMPELSFLRFVLLSGRGVCGPVGVSTV